MVYDIYAFIIIITKNGNDDFVQSPTLKLSIYVSFQFVGGRVIWIRFYRWIKLGFLDVWQHGERKFCY